jgi:hypothetical protein
MKQHLRIIKTGNFHISKSPNLKGPVESWLTNSFEAERSRFCPMSPTYWRSHLGPGTAPVL